MSKAKFLAAGYVFVSLCAFVSGCSHNLYIDGSLSNPHNIFTGDTTASPLATELNNKYYSVLLSSFYRIGDYWYDFVIYPTDHLSAGMNAEGRIFQPISDTVSSTLIMSVGPLRRSGRRRLLEATDTIPIIDIKHLPNDSIRWIRTFEAGYYEKPYVNEPEVYRITVTQDKDQKQTFTFHIHCNLTTGDDENRVIYHVEIDGKSGLVIGSATTYTYRGEVVDEK